MNHWPEDIYISMEYP